MSSLASDPAREARVHPAHTGIVLAQQRDWSLASLIAAVDRILVETSAEDCRGQVSWLADGRS